MTPAAALVRLIAPTRRLAPPSLLVALIAVAPIGCSTKEKLEPLAPQFYAQIPLGPRAPKPMAADPFSGSDQPGAIYDDGMFERDLRAAPSGHPNDVRGLSQTVRDNVTAPGETPPDFTTDAATTQPTTVPATRAVASVKESPSDAGPGATTTTTAPAPVADGQFLTVGGVVAEVNGVPIYANKLLTLVEPVLAARARDYQPAQFRDIASREIMQQRNSLITLELEYAAAERKLDEKEKQLADAMTEQWRQQQIGLAGGSIELARRRAADRGEDFDELVKQRYRLHMSQVYYQKKIYPRIQITAADIRAYYDRNLDREFTQRGAARFRLIKIDIAKAGGREQALAKITGLRNRVVKAGQPFEEIARSVNDNAAWRRSGGDLGADIEAGAFKIDAVDKAVWATPVGELSEVIDGGDAFYLAKVERKTQGSVQSFDDPDVQSRIADILRSEQFRALRSAEQEKLVKDAYIRADKAMLNPAIEMAVQNYSRWRGGAPQPG